MLAALGTLNSVTNPTSKNHYLPQFYLRRFCDSAGRVLRTAKTADGQLHEKRFAPKHTGYEENLYSLFDAGPLLREKETDVLERKVFQPIDSGGAEGLRALLDSAKMQLSDDEKTRWATFVSSLFERHPQRIREGDARAAAMGKERLQALRQHFGAPPPGRLDIFDHIDPEQLARNMYRGHLVKEIHNPKRIDYLKTFVLLKMTMPERSEHSFFTGDDPVFFEQDARPAAWLSLALDPKNLLLAHHPSEEFDPDVLASLAMIHNLELFTRCEYIFSREPLVDSPSLKYRSAAAVHLKATEWRRT